MTEVGAALTRCGHEVRSVGLFVDLLRWLMRYGDSAAVVLELPSGDSFRLAVLKEVRRQCRRVPVVALARAVTVEVERDAEANQVRQVLPTAAPVEEIVEAVQHACDNPGFRLVAVGNETGVEGAE